MFKNFFFTIPIISSLIFGGFPISALAKGGQFEISVVSKEEIKNAVAEIGDIRVPLGDLRPGANRVQFSSSKRLPAGVPVRILSSGFFGDKIVSERVVAGSFANPAPDPGCTVASDYRAQISVSPGSAILTGGEGELVVGVGPDTRAEVRSLSLSLSKSDSGNRRITDPVILESLRRAPATLMFTGSAEQATLYMINKNGSLARKSAFHRETIANLSASYDKLGVKNVAEVMGIPAGTSAAVKEALSRVTNLENEDGFVFLVSPPSAGQNMNVLIKRSSNGKFEPLGEIGSANFQVGYIQAGQTLHVFVSEALLTQGIVSRHLGRNSANINNSHDAGHKILSLGWLSVGNASSRQFSGWRLINLALAQFDLEFDDVSLVAAEIVSNPPPAAWGGGDSPPAPSGAPASTGASPIIPPLTGSSASKKKESSGFGFEGVAGGQITFGGSEGARIGPFIGGVPRDSGFGPATDPFRGGREDAPLGPGFTIQGEGSALDKCFDGKFDRKGGGLQLPPKPEPTGLERAFREGFQRTGAGGSRETGAAPGLGAGGFAPPTPRKPIVTPGGTGFAPPPTPVSEDDLRGGILDRVLQIFTR
jgi:hypothetical protein